MVWKTLSSKCPKCGLYKNRPIVLRLKIKNKIYFLLKCCNCNYLFEHHNYKLWRELKFKYGVPTKIIRNMQRGMIEDLVKKGNQPFIIKDRNLLVFNEYLFMKNDKEK